MNIISWHPVLTDHQSYTLEALQHAAEATLTVYVAKMEDPARQAQGWVNVHSASLAPQLIPQTGWFTFIIQQLKTHKETVHFFGSPFEQPKLIITLLLAIAMGRRVFLISEPYSPVATGYQHDKHTFITRVKTILRPLLYAVYGAMLRRRIAGVFAISPLAVSQYQRIGIAKEKIFPFGYFVPRTNCLHSTPPIAATLKLIFIGTLIARKGLDILINAVSKVNANSVRVTLDVYGSGDAGQFDFDSSTIRYCGLLPFGQAQTVIADYDALVLPSRYDGWGVVVNEALMAGVPIICSDCVGAGAVLEKWQCGVIFASEDVADLASKLNILVSTPESLLKMRVAAQQAAAIFEPEVAGRYIFDILRQSVPATLSCPWY
ncbi:MAG: glycosyltransferase [Methylococcales bacterium]|nr:glycosyltransferase [Methylococcales bacterium]